MKINIEKIAMHQAGGYLTYRPLTAPPDQLAPQEQESAPAGRKAVKDDGIDDKAMEKLLGNGITNDVMQFSDEITGAQTQYENLTDSEKEGPRGKQLRSILRGNVGQLNALLRSKKLFDDSIAKASAAGGLEEFAVTPQGFVVKQEDGSIGQVAFSQFAKDKSEGKVKYKPLTNAELVNEREFNKTLTGNKSIFAILDYAKGMPEIQKEVLSIASGIGKTSQSSSNGAYDEGTVEAMREAKLAAGQGVFKVKESTSESTNAPQIQRAKEVMWSTLSDNSKNVLRARAAFLEKDPSKIEQRAALLAMDLLDPRLEQSKSSTSDMAYTKGAKSGSGGKGGSEATANIGARESAVNGKTQQEHVELLSEYGVDIASRMYTLPYEDITRKDKDGVIRPTTINGSELGKYGYVNKATDLNGDKIDPTGTIFTGDAYYTRLPVKRTANGGLILDEEGAKKLAEAERQYRALPAAQQKTVMMDKIKQKLGVGRLDIQEVILAEAASFDNQYRWGGLGGQKDKKYYKEADDATKKLLGDVVDPDSKGARNWLDYKAYKHMVIIPSKGEAAARFADGNSFVIPKDGINLTNPERGVQTSSRSFEGSAFQSANDQFSINALDK